MPHRGRRWIDPPILGFPASSPPPPPPPPSPPTLVEQGDQLAFSPVSGPWQRAPFLPIIPDHIIAPPAPPAPSPQIMEPQFYGGPLPGPWQRGFPGPIIPTDPGFNPPLVPPPPPPPTTPAKLPFVPRLRRPVAVADKPLGAIGRPTPVPPKANQTADNRLRRNTDQVSSILNSLIAQGILVQTSDNTWTLIVAEPIGLTGTFDSGPFGV